MNRILYTVISLLLTAHVVAQQTGTVYSASEAMDGEGAEVLRLFPSKSFKHADPFILLDHFNVSPPAGFPAHEHKGFEAITYMLSGAFVHKDNMENTDTITAGQAQRFTAGTGLMHSEMPGTAGGNTGLQLWLNIPFHAKQGQPSYQMATFLPVQSTEDSTCIVRTIVGQESALNVHCDCNLSYQDVQLKSDSIRFSPIKGYTSFVYVIQGDIEISELKIISGEFYFLESGMTHTIAAASNARFVYLSARPLNQPIKQRGPYVY